MLAVAAASAVAQKNASDRATVAAAKAANDNTAEGYRVAQENSRQADAQAFEAQTDRARKAARDLSMARVIAAQGGGSLAARAININAGAAEDYSRIDTSLSNQHATVRGQMAAYETQAGDAAAQAQAQFNANQTRFLSSVGSAVATSASQGYSNIKTDELARNTAASNKLPK